MPPTPELTWLTTLRVLFIGLVTWEALQPSPFVPITTNIKRNARRLYPNRRAELVELHATKADRQFWVAGIIDGEEQLLVTTGQCESRAKALRRLNDILERKIRDEALEAAGRILCKL